uniref:Protein kinase n=1 Tax=Bodo saltans TaxID=75058 RepID=B6DTM2_BODSA|nr:protein kinase [Bodo saltans]
MQVTSELDANSLNMEEDGRGDLNRDSVDDGDVNEASQPSTVAAVSEGRRIAVSAAPIAMNTIKDYKPRVVPKTPSEEEVVRKGVQGCHLFATMEAEEREVIVKALEKEEFDAGTDVLKQGAAPKDRFFMITEGTCEVIKNGKHVASLNGGATFGELEMMYKQTECAATIRCVTNCVMYSLDQQSYQHIVLNVSVQKRERYQRLLHRVGFLEALSDYDRMTIAEALVTTEYRADDKIISFGEKGQWMHIIIDGEVQVVGRDRGKKVDVVRLGEGNVVGELEFLFDHLTVADVVAATPRVVTARINRKHFEMVLGPITDQLKKFVAKNETYAHYLADADEKVKAEITMLEKRVRRVAKAHGGELLDNLDKDGEIVITDPTPIIDQGISVNRNGTQQKEAVYRFPLKPVMEANFIMIGLREDGMIVLWNDAMSRVTNYQSAEVCGQSFYSFIHSIKDQETMHTAINDARAFTGNIEGFYQSQVGKEKNTFVFARSDGLTKATLQLTVIPSVVAQGSNVADIMLAIGHEVKRPPPMKQNDYSHWVAEQVRSLINDTALEADDRLSRIGGVVQKFETLIKGSNISADELRVVNVRQLIGQVVMDYGAMCVEKGLSVKQNYDEMYCDEVYCDAHLLPECLRYAMSNCTNHISENCSIRIKVAVEEVFGSEQLMISINDNGPGFPSKVLDEFNGVTSTGSFAALLRVKAAVEKQGGTMQISSVPGDTHVIFRIPFIPQEESEDMSDIPMDLGGSLANHQSMAFVKKQTYTTLVVEDMPAHRNMLCAFLWERKHAVLPAYSLTDINRLADVTDILIIDPQQSILSDPSAIADPFAMLREKARSVAVIVTAPSFDEGTKKAYQAAGFFTLQKPCTAIQAVQVLRKAEEKISKIKSEADKIAQTRDTLAKNSRGAWKKGMLLGKGAFGEVFEAIDVLTGGKMAVKMLRVTDKMNKDELLHEIEVMCTLQHPNIIHYFYCEDNTEARTINVFMEFAAGGTVQGLLAKKGKLDFKEFQTLLRDIVEGIAYTHGKRYVHSDIKTANVLLNHEGKGKIGDFGTAKQLSEGELLYIMQGSPLYMSPECMSAGELKEDGSGEQIGFSYPSDIWSLGCVVMEMATNKPPFSHIEFNGPVGLMSFVTGLTDIPDLSPLFDLPPSVIEFVSACLHPDPAKRPTAQALLGYSIFNETTDDDLKSALKALKRAQLLHVLNKFVAFQDEEELEQQKRDQARFKTARRDSAFFDSSDDDESGGDKDGESDFFASSDDEEDDDDEKKSHEKEKATEAEGSAPPSKTGSKSGMTPISTVPSGVHGQPKRNLFAVDDPAASVAGSTSTSQTTAQQQHHHTAPSSQTSVTAPAFAVCGAEDDEAPAMFAALHTLESDTPHHATAAALPTSAAVTATPPPGEAKIEQHSDAMDLLPSTQTTQVAHIQPASESDEDAASAPKVGFTPKPPSQNPPSSPHGRHTSVEIGSTSSGSGIRSPPTNVVESAAIHTQQRHQVIVLHDALLSLVDELRKLNRNVEATDALLHQYKAHTSNTEGGDDGTPKSSPTATSSFLPDVEQLLRDDTEVIRTLIQTLAGGIP